VRDLAAQIVAADPPRRIGRYLCALELRTVI